MLAEVRRRVAADLAAGRGRAWELVRRSRGRGWEREVDRVCLRALGFDPQVEGSRGEWLYGLAQMAGRVEALRPRMTRALRRGGDSWTRIQQYDWLAEDALHGSEDARAGLRAALRAHPEVAHYDPAPALRALGFEAFEIVLGAIASRDDPADVHGFLSVSKEELGVARTRAWSQRVADTDPRVAAALKASARWSRRRKRRLRRPWSRAKVDAIVEGRERYAPLTITRWARTAPKAEFPRLERRLATERDPSVLVRLLHAFFEHPLGGDVGRVLQLESSDDPALAEAALRALGPVHDPRARKLVLDRLERGAADRVGHCIHALANGRNPEASAAIRSRLRRGVPRRIIDHDVVSAVLEFAEKRPREELSEALEWAWDRCACSLCRADLLRKIVRRGRIPARIRREASKDSNPDVRRIAAGRTARGVRR